MNSDFRLNIVSFDIPYPPDYGGVIDVFYKIKALSEIGVKIILHNFHYGRSRSAELESLCEEVYYYQRKRWVNPISVNMPYIVKTRKSSELLEKLITNEDPILFEGLHCTYYVNHPGLKNRIKVVRMHNIEYIYYKHLAKVEKNFFKKIYYNNEATCLRDYQQVLSNVDFVAAISPNDNKILNLKHGNSFYLPVFHPNEEVSSKSRKGEYVLYHGNLGVGENNEAALFLINQVVGESGIPTIIAGHHPSKELKKAVREHYHIKLIEPGFNEMDELIANAQINILPTFQDTGIKLKLLNALYKGRFCVVNNKMVKNTGLANLCIVANKAKEMKSAITKYFDEDFNGTEISQRIEVLTKNFDNHINAQILVQKVFRS